MQLSWLAAAMLLPTFTLLFLRALELRAGAIAHAPGRVFSSRVRAAWVRRLGWVEQGTIVIAPALVIALGGRGGSLPRAGLLATATLAGIALSLVALEFLAARPWAAVRRGLAARLMERGLDPEAAGGLLVGLSPGPAARVYGGFSDWDAGHLFVAANRLAYVGEEARFTLRREQIVCVRLGPGLPGWFAAPRVVIEWRDDAGGAPRALTLRPAGLERPSEYESAAAGVALWLMAWHMGGADPGMPADVPDAALAGDETPVPPPGEAAGLSPKILGDPRTLVPQAAVLALFAALACALLGLPFAPPAGPGFADTLVAAIAAAVFHRVPAWRWREASADEHAPERRAAA